MCIRTLRRSRELMARNYDSAIRRAKCSVLLSLGVQYVICRKRLRLTGEKVGGPKLKESIINP
jgi:hypothetical protein